MGLIKYAYLVQEDQDVILGKPSGSMLPEDPRTREQPILLKVPQNARPPVLPDDMRNDRPKSSQMKQMPKTIAIQLTPDKGIV